MPVSEIVIRVANADDVLQLRDLSRSTFYETYADQNTADDVRMHMQQTFSIEKLTSELEDASNAFFIASQGDKMVGYAKLRTTNPLPKSPAIPAIELERIYVSKASQGLKAGDALMRTCIEYSKKNGYEVLWLGVWERNPRAISFYEKWGFAISGKQTFTLGKDMQSDLVMVREL
jgi:ribosomal protein S18 acetylase RimI-like enzyme